MLLTALAVHSSIDRSMCLQLFVLLQNTDFLCAWKIICISTIPNKVNTLLNVCNNGK